MTDANGCQGVSGTPFVVSNIVNTSVISGPINPAQFNTVTYSVVPSSGSTYDWTLIGGTVSGQGTNSIDVFWNYSGIFSFSTIETDVNGCEGEAVSLMVNVIVNSVEEDIGANNKELLKVTDILGEETSIRSNMPLLYMYDDGTIEKKIILE